MICMMKTKNANENRKKLLGDFNKKNTSMY